MGGPSLSTVIVGGGITGLATAYYLEQAAAKHGWDLTGVLVEREQRLGGKLLTIDAAGFLVEGGPDSFLTLKPWALRMAVELGMEDDVLYQQSEGVFLLHGGRLHRIPAGVVGLVPTRPWALLGASFLSWRGKLRAGLEPFIRPRRDGGQESLGEFMRRRLGPEAAQRLAEPFTAGIYAGDALQLGVRDLFPTLVEWEDRYGSLTAGRRAARATSAGRPPARPFASLRGGMGSLTQAIIGSLRRFTLHTGKGVTAIARDVGEDHSAYRISFEDGESIIADSVAMTVPARPAATVLRTLVPKVASILDELSAVSTGSVALAYRREAVDHPLTGSGFLAPRGEPSPFTGCTWSSSKWAERAPSGWVLLRAFVGSAGDESFLNRDDPDLVRLVAEGLRPLLGLRGEPSRAWVHRWPGAMPQYRVGHGARMDRLDQAMADHPGLFLTGASYRGIGIPDCIRQAQETAARMEQMVLQRAVRPDRQDPKIMSERHA